MTARDVLLVGAVLTALTWAARAVLWAIQAPARRADRPHEWSDQ